MNTYNPAFMQRAITLSQEAYTSGKGLPIGCVIVKNNQIIGEGHNEIFMRKTRLFRRNSEKSDSLFLCK